MHSRRVLVRCLLLANSQSTSSMQSRCFSNSDAVDALKAEFRTTKEMAAWLKERGPGGNVRYSRMNHIGSINIDNTSKRNSFTGAMMADFSSSVTSAVEDKDTRLIIVRGKDGHFCSGGELNFVEKIANETGSFVMNSLMMDALNRLSRTEKVSIAVLDGVTMGGASEIASACDIRLAHKKATVGFVQGNMGVCPGWGGGKYLVNSLGASKAVEYLSTAAVVNAEELYRIGFVNYLFETEDELNEYLNRFQRIKVRDAFHAAKKMVSTYRSDLKELEEEERRIFMSVWGKEGHQKSIEGIRQSLKKQKESKGK